MFVQKDIHLLFRYGKKSVGTFFFVEQFLTVLNSWKKKILLGALRTRISCGRAISSQKKKHGNHVSIWNSSHSKRRMLLFHIIVHSTWPVEYLNILDHLILDHSTFDKIACFWLDEIMFNTKLHSPGVSLCGLGANPGVETFVGWVCCWFSPLLREIFPLSLKTNPFKFQFDLERADTFQQVLNNSKVLRGWTNYNL